MLRLLTLGCLLSALLVGAPALAQISNNPTGGGNSFPGVVNVKSYGAQGDTLVVNDAVTNGTTTVTSATAAFNSGRDVGKVVWGIKITGGGSGEGTLSVPIGTISSVTNSTTIVVSAGGEDTNTGVTLYWGHDDTAALQAAFAAAFNSSVGFFSPVVATEIYVPAGRFMFSAPLGIWTTAGSTPYLVPAIVGAGSYNTQFVIRPDFNWSTLSGIGNTASPFVNVSLSQPPQTTDFEGFAFDGGGYDFFQSSTGSSYYASRLFQLYGTLGAYMRDIAIDHWQFSEDAGTDGVAVFVQNGTTDVGNSAHLEHIFIHSVRGVGLWVYDSSADVHGLFEYECGTLYCFQASHSAVEMFGGIIADNGGSPGNQIETGSVVSFYGVRFRAQSGTTKINVTGSGTYAAFFASNLNVVSGGNSTALTIGSGATVMFSGDIIHSAGSGVWVANSGGTFIDDGTNTYVADSGSGGFTGIVPVGTGSCSITSQTGGTSRGTFTASGACVAGTVILTFNQTAPSGWTCKANDQTTPADLMNQTASTIGSATLTGSMVNSDVVSFNCVPY